MNLQFVIASVLWYIAATVHGTLKVGGADGTQKLTFKTPKISEEEAHSRHIPKHLKCDACRVVAYQMYNRFKEFNKVHKHLKYNVPESDVIDMLDSVCGNSETFNAYGLKEVKGENRLSGPGLETSGVPAVLSGGGKWPGRLMAVCAEYVGELGEDEIYAAYKRNPTKKKVLEDLLCYGDGVLGDCEGYRRKYFMEL